MYYHYYWETRVLCSLLEENWEQNDKDSLPDGIYLNQSFFHETKTHSRKKWILWHCYSKFSEYISLKIFLKIIYAKYIWITYFKISICLNIFFYVHSKFGLIDYLGKLFLPEFLAMVVLWFWKWELIYWLSWRWWRCFSTSKQHRNNMQLEGLFGSWFHGSLVNHGNEGETKFLKFTAGVPHITEANGQ